MFLLEHPSFNFSQALSCHFRKEAELPMLRTLGTSSPILRTLETSSPTLRMPGTSSPTQDAGDISPDSDDARDLFPKPDYVLRSPPTAQGGATEQGWGSTVPGSVSAVRPPSLGTARWGKQTGRGSWQEQGLGGGVCPLKT